MARLSIRIDFEEERRIGPGKVRLLEELAELGSISAAGRAMGMSYRRAWELIADLNGTFAQPLVAARAGGRHGGGAALTPFGAALVREYRTIEALAGEAAGEHLAALDAALTKE
jgi:molybdate transport system regulatory protein